MTLIKQLQQFGLTEVQAKIYLAILDIKKATVLHIAKTIGVQRPTIYDNVAILEDLSLISRTVDKGRVYIIPNDPQSLYGVISQKQNIAKALLPDLENLYNKEHINKPTVKFFHGDEGFKKLADLILDSKSKVIRTLADYEENIRGAFSQKYLLKLWEVRSRRNIKTQVLFTDRSKDILLGDKAYTEASNIRYGREVRILPKSIDFRVHYTIVDDNVLFWSAKKEDFSMQFVSESYAKSLISLFDYLWKESEEFKGK